jgi:hypothetical protein
LSNKIILGEDLMKKIIYTLLIVAMASCSANPFISHKPTNPEDEFEHIVIKKAIKQRPTFSVNVDWSSSEYHVWFKNEIEKALMQNRVSILLLDRSKKLVTETDAESKAASAQIDQNNGASKNKVNIISKTELRNETKADYILHADYDLYSFDIIEVESQEIIAKGVFSNNIKRNIGVIIKKMGIPPL